MDREIKLKTLLDTIKQQPGDVHIYFEIAGIYDYLDHESEALVYYEKVFELGYTELPQEDQPCLFLQTGSTLRNLKRYEEARKILIEGIQKFPDFTALKVFLALTDYSSGNFKSAAYSLFNSIQSSSTDSSLKTYERAIKHYIENLDK